MSSLGCTDSWPDRGRDSDNDGRTDKYENLADRDGDNITDYLDTDSNNDGVDDADDDSDSGEVQALSSMHGPTVPS
jgi:hypothetical protein